ncbi:MAG: CapA family protein [Chloroflexi bacterium]|nr:CapA family protein [Chloroflexota bacterium]
MAYESTKRNITMALAGDCLIHRDLSAHQEEPFLEMVRLMREADITYANLEGVAHEYENPPGYHSPSYYTAFPPRCLQDLKWMGVKVVSTANNHSMDFGEGGLVTTLKHLDSAGLGHAGTGRNLWEARAPGYVQVAAGRVALISATAAFDPHYRAGEQTPQVRGRPGASCLGVVRDYVVDRETIQFMKKLGERLGDDARKERLRQQNIFPLPKDTESLYHFFGSRFALGNSFTVRTSCNQRDKEAILKRVRDAARMADWVIVALHCHEYEMEPEVPPNFVKEFAKACIDAGAHCFAGHGPHMLQGIEVYKGRPIFYSLGNFIFMLETIERHPPDLYDRYGLGMDALPSDMTAARIGDNDTFGFPASARYWRSALPVCEWQEGELQQVRLHPLDLGFQQPWPARGRPMLASGELGQEILEGLQKASEPFGTHIRIADGVGVIAPDTQPRRPRPRRG